MDDKDLRLATAMAFGAIDVPMLGLSPEEQEAWDEGASIVRWAANVQAQILWLKANGFENQVAPLVERIDGVNGVEAAVEINALWENAQKS